MQLIQIYLAIWRLRLGTAFGRAGFSPTSASGFTISDKRTPLKRWDFSNAGLANEPTQV
jgi:hypothetical protein